MKQILLILLLLIGFISTALAGNGAFIITKSTYLYGSSTKAGKKILTRKKDAYEVIAMDMPKPDQVMLKIIIPFRTMTINGSGFILETDPELKELGENKIKVYHEVPNKGSDLSKYSMIPSNKLVFTGKENTTPDFPNLVFRGVNFKTKTPLQLWVDEWAGIYRPDKDHVWLSGIYKNIKERNFKVTLQKKILQGLVEAGFSREQVKMSLGEPEKELFSEDGTKLEWVYSDRKVFFEDNKVVRVF